MNPNQPDALRAPGPFSMRTNAPHFPSKAASKAASKSASRLTPPIGADHTTCVPQDPELALIARRNFEAGFSAGASQALQPAESRSASADAPHATDALTDLVTHLTPRRFEVLEFVARGLTNREIAKVMGISTNTVKAHVTGVLETLDLTNRTEAAIALQAYESERIQRTR
jgi:DNA-binding NarL/FixJ family response regulator